MYITTYKNIKNRLRTKCNQIITSYEIQRQMSHRSKLQTVNPGLYIYIRFKPDGC